MSTEISLVMFAVKRYKKGDKESSAFLDSEVQFSYPNWEEVALYNMNEFERDEENLFEDEDVTFKKECYCVIEVSCVGESFSEAFISGIHFELDGIGNEMFEGFEEQIADIAKKLLQTNDKKLETFFPQKQKPEPNNFVQFVSAWKYNSYHDTYWDEFDADWNCLGLVKMNKIADLFKEQ